MSGVAALFKRCPACKKRFHVTSVSRRVKSDFKERRVQKVRAEGTDIMVGSRYQNPNPQVLYVDVPVTVDVEELEFSYRCGYCGHEWAESRKRETEVD